MSNSNKLNFSLYHYQSCPYCAITRQAIKQTELNIEQRNVSKQPQYRSELIKEGGKSQVPCLRIEKENGDVHWLYESQDIIQFIRQYAKKTKQAA
jgi:glutaredoxin